MAQQYTEIGWLALLSVRPTAERLAEEVGKPLWCGLQACWSHMCDMRGEYLQLDTLWSLHVVVSTAEFSVLNHPREWQLTETCGLLQNYGTSKTGVQRLKQRKSPIVS